MNKVSEQDLLSLSSKVGKNLIEKELTIATAESCTGGLLSHTLTGISGSSGYFVGGVVAYSNRIKEQSLDVDPMTIIKYGAVSEETAREMAQGICQKFDADIGLSTTGIAGPTGGTPEKPVGLVWIGIQFKDQNCTYECHFKGDRGTIKTKTVKEILARLLEILN
jgi:PncC family amidohydrolase